MKKILLTFLFFLLIGLASSANAADLNCTQVMQKFEMSKGEIDGATREKINSCNGLCKNIPNYKYAAAYCGVDDCKLEYARTGRVSDWCARLSRYWEDKQGVVENPLEMIREDTNRQDFMYCVENFNANSTVPEECCSNLTEIAKFNKPTGRDIEKYCSRRKAANACATNYLEKRRFTPACCAYARASKNKFVEMPEFLEDQELAENLEASVKGCKSISFNKNYLVRSCLAEYNSSKNINSNCCKAFEKGVLVPELYGMGYASLDRACRN